MAHDDEDSRIQRAKDEFFASPAPERWHDVELMSSWQRSQLAIGTPDMVTDVPHVGEDLLDAHLLEVFRAPLARFSDSLDGTGLAVLLADSSGRILQRWCHDTSAAAHLDRIGTSRGAVLAENAVGTNGVGTVAVTGKSVQIRGAEHFADLYRNAVCTGAPVLHPATGKLLAVVTISCDVRPGTDFLRPLLRSVTTQLEQHVLDVEQPSARHTFNAFLTATRAQSAPVLAFGPEGLLIQNPPAGSLSTQDIGLIRELCDDGVRDGQHSVPLSNGPATISVTNLDPGNRIVVLLPRETPAPRTAPAPERPRRDELAGHSSGWLRVAREVAAHRDAGTPLIVAGEPGSGKTSLALGAPFRPEVHARGGRIVDAAEAHVSGAQAWLQHVAGRLAGAEPLVIRGVGTLEEKVLAGLRSVVESTPASGPVVLTLTGADEAAAEAFALKLGIAHLWVPPLRERPQDISVLWHAFALAAAPGTGLAPSRETLELMRAYHWPGNVRELKTVFTQAVKSRGKGPVEPADLPRALQKAQPLTMIERMELEAIQRALQEAGGNRGKAAEILGISRATVYRKMKAYRLTA
ncbi:sigma-54-dependent Fis family transcriptional regulator [Amycolatopsis sp. NPDC051903]|uniref:sigma-54-dependent Fis family transcriptional regulator n=1 Tax=Amycolatopsis sp. NPDC051903 TaxID=3363936 RepID=UPI0037B96FE0